MTHESFIWVEAFRPHNVADCILPKRIKTVFENFASTGQVTNYIAVGSAGCGKTSATRALLEELNLEYIVINASEEGNIDTIRTTVRNFASRFSITGGYRVILLDEGDYLTPTAQAALRGVIEEFADNCRFIITANYQNRIIPALQSRCPVIEFNFSEDEKREMVVAFSKRLFALFADMGITYAKSDLVRFVNSNFPDFRGTLNLLQRSLTPDGKTIELKVMSSGVSNNIFKSLVNAMSNKDYNELRSIVASTPELDTVKFRQDLYNNITKVVDDDAVWKLVSILNDFDRHEPHVKNLDIHTMAMLLEIMTNCSPIKKITTEQV